MNAHWDGIRSVDTGRGASCSAQRRRVRRAGSGRSSGRGVAGIRRRSAQSAGRRRPHFPAKAKRVIFLFMHGGPSQVDTFDHKPLLDRDHGKPLPFAKPRVVSGKTGNLLRSPFQISALRAKRHRRQRAVSLISPRHVDDLCMINSMHGSNSRHGGALLELHTGSDTFVRPSMGSWITYGLGTENQDLPGLHHHLPKPEPRRREQLELGVFAGRLPGDADRQYGRAVRPGQDSVYREWLDLAAVAAAASST